MKDLESDPFDSEIVNAGAQSQFPFSIIATASFIPGILDPDLKEIINTVGHIETDGNTYPDICSYFGPNELTTGEIIYLIEFIGAVSYFKRYKENIQKIHQTERLVEASIDQQIKEIEELLPLHGLYDIESLEKYLSGSRRITNQDEINCLLLFKKISNLKLALDELNELKYTARSILLRFIGVVSIGRTLIETSDMVEEFAESWFAKNRPTIDMLLN